MLGPVGQPNGMRSELPVDLAEALRQNAARLGPFGCRVTYFDQVESTNDIAARLAAQGAEEGTVVVAGSQTAGRGHRGREWFSPPGAGLYVSVVLRPARPDAADERRVASLITMTSGVALAEAVLAATGLPVELKWPNDLVIGRPWRKLAGILAEASTTSGRLEYVILGFGINIRAARYPMALGDRATSLEVEAGRSVDAWPVLVEALAALAARYAELRRGGSSALLDRWRTFAPGTRGGIVEWRSGGGPQRGIAEGIDDEGALLVRVGSRIERLVAGEVNWVTQEGNQ